MKKIIVAISLLVAFFNSYSQDISGIGDYKIGMTIDSFLEIPYIQNKKLEDKTSSMYVPDENSLWKTTINSKLDNYQRIYSKDVVKFEFQTSIGIAKSLGEDLYWTELIFYKNNLASINVIDAESSFEKVLTLKYGKPHYENKTTKVTCQNGFGAKSTHTDGTIYWKWGSGKKITAEYNYSFFSCGKGAGGYTVANTEVMKLVRQFELKGSKDEELKESLEKAKGSKL